MVQDDYLMRHLYYKMKRISFAVIGGGPAGFYISKLLSRLSCEPFIDIFEKQLCPFGLIRYGVAPDHISIKKSEMVLSEVAHYPLFRYFGNFQLDELGINKLRQKYSGIIYAYGASQNHVPNWLPKAANLKDTKIKLARDLVYWYNGHPEQENEKQNLENVRNIVIVGNGNVAVDVARVLLRDPKQLQYTQISKKALSQLKNCQIQNIQIIARRGVTHSAFAIKQVRELHKLGFKLYAVEEELQESMTNASQIQCTAIGDHFSSIVRMNKRKVDFIKEKFIILKEKQIQTQKAKPGRKIFFRYLLNPKKVENNQLLCQKTKLEGEAFKQTLKSKGIQISLKFELLIISTGFEVSSINSQHFDNVNKRVRHSNGCVINVADKIDIGSYVVGWCKNGPKGVLDETLLSCQQTLNNIRIHIENGLLVPKTQPEAPKNFIPFQKYAQVRDLELQRGNKQKFIKKKLSHQQLIEFYGLNDSKHKLVV